MIITKNQDDVTAVRLLSQFAGKQSNRRLLALLALDRIAAIQTNIGKLHPPDAIDSIVSSYVDEILWAVETVLQNDTNYEGRRAKRGADEVHE